LFAGQRVGLFVNAPGLREFGEALIVVGVVGAHDTVPYVEIDPIISVGFFMVHDVVGGGVQHVTQPTLHHPSWIELKSCVSQNVVKNLPPHEHAKCQRVNRDEKGSQREDGSLRQSLPKTERIGCPGGGVVGLMVDLVNPVEKFCMMHPSMGPVEIGVMEQDGQNDTCGKPSPSSLSHAPIDARVTHPGQCDRQHAYCSKDDNGERGVEQFPPDILPTGLSFDNFAVKPSGVKEPVAQGPRNEGQYKVSDADHHGDPGKDFQRVEVFDHCSDLTGIYYHQGIGKSNKIDPQFPIITWP